MVVYPIRDDIDGQGRQLINWVAELKTPQRGDRDWNRDGRIEDVIAPFAEWRFDWLDVPELIRSAEQILEYPMVDQDPLDRWSFGRVTLLGDAAHPMVPRGSNGGGQAILDTRALTDALSDHADPVSALREYEQRRRTATAQVVRLNRTNPPTPSCARSTNAPATSRSPASKTSSAPRNSRRCSSTTATRPATPTKP
ncbi:FAD-dependent monooxygenase [Actinomadura madurae]|nr:FAD-dependent monooxygenase [Actinomadura madurae]MCP9977433.1 FAD-dependent monooxygenase [Actinomadura madurae]